MKEIEVIHLLQHYRHDLLNKLQLVQGYLSMDKKAKVEEKLEELFVLLNEERKLTSLQAPKFAIWLLQFNHVYKNFRITYKIDTETKTFQSHDEILTEKSRELIDCCEKISDPFKLYDIELTIHDNVEADKVEMLFFINGLKNSFHTLDINVENIIDHMEETEEGIILCFGIPKVK